MKLTYKKSSLLTILIVIIVLLLPALAVYVVDPFQIYHKRLFFKVAQYSAEKRYQHAGWINTVLGDPDSHYQAIIIGPSTTSNYTSSMVNDFLPWGETLNLSLQGGFPAMSAAMARHSLKHSTKIQHVLWDVHIFYSNDDPDYDNNSAFPYYLYNDTFVDDYPYLINATNIKTVKNFLNGDFNEFSNDIVHNGPFYQELFANNAFETFKSLDYRRTQMLPAIQKQNIGSLDGVAIHALKYPSLDKNLLDVILPYCGKSMDINILFTPHARYLYASNPFPSYIQSLIYMRRYVVEHTRECSNIKVFAFDNEDWITTNLDHYAGDYFHFDLDINKYILSSIANGDHRLTVDNISEYETTFITKINGYPDLFIASLSGKK